MMAGSDSANGSASALIDRPGCSASRVNKARRVGSASAAKVRSSGALSNLTIELSIGGTQSLSSGLSHFFAVGRRWEARVLAECLGPHVQVMRKFA